MCHRIVSPSCLAREASNSGSPAKRGSWGVERLSRTSTQVCTCLRRLFNLPVRRTNQPTSSIMTEEMATAHKRETW